MSDGIDADVMAQFATEWDDYGIALTHRVGDCDWLVWVWACSLAELGATAREHAATCDGTRIAPPPLTAEERASAEWMHSLWGRAVLGTLHKPLLFNEPRTGAPDA